MRKFKKILVIFFAVCACAFTLGACSTTTKGGSAKGSTDLDISSPQFDFVRSEEYDPETYVFNPNKKWTDLDVDTAYYMFLTFDVAAMRNNDGQSVLNVNITFDALNVLDATVQEANTGNYIEAQFIDGSTATLGKKMALSFKVPQESAKPKTIAMTIELKPVSEGESHIIIGYEYNEPGYKLSGSDGHTQNLKINKVQLERPVVTLDEFGALNWKHVKNADYYYVYKSTDTNNPLTDPFGDPIIVEADMYATGDIITLPIFQYIYGYYSLVVRAFSDNPNITPSAVSQPVSYMW